MPNIIGVYLYGSYARGEEKKESDIDILVIVKEKDEKIKNIFDDIDIRILTIEQVQKLIMKFPAIIMPILKESKTLLNPFLLEELENKEIDFRRFNWHFDDIRRIIKIIEKFVEIDEQNIDVSNIYSLIMRIRILYMIEGLIYKKPFSNAGIKGVLLNHGLSEERYDKFYSIYQNIRDNRYIKDVITKEDVLELIEILKNYLRKIENETKKKIKKGD